MCIGNLIEFKEMFSSFADVALLDPFPQGFGLVSNLRVSTSDALANADKHSTMRGDLCRFYDPSHSSGKGSDCTVPRRLAKTLTFKNKIA